MKLPRTFHALAETPAACSRRREEADWGDCGPRPIRLVTSATTRFQRSPSPRKNRACGGFTLAEVLAALLFMAIVIPVAVHGLQIANRAGQLGERKAIAARIGERVLNELVVTRQWQSASQRGTIHEGVLDYEWQIQLEPWNQGVLRLLTVLVTFPVQGQNYDIRLSTLVDTSLQ